MSQEMAISGEVYIPDSEVWDAIYDHANTHPWGDFIAWYWNKSGKAEREVFLAGLVTEFGAELFEDFDPPTIAKHPFGILSEVLQVYIILGFNVVTPTFSARLAQAHMTQIITSVEERRGRIISFPE